MASRYLWSNNDGLNVKSGRRTSDNEAASKINQGGSDQTLEFIIPQDETGNAAEQTYSSIVPKNAVINDVKLFADGDLTGLTGLTIGVADYDEGTDLTDPDGLVLAMAGADVTGLAPSGGVVGTLFDGALLTSSAPLSEAVVITWTAATASTAGNIKAIVEFTLPNNLAT